MGKIYKVALVLFYLLQLVIVFHEQVMHLFERAASPIHDSTASEEARDGFLRKLRHAMGQHHTADVVLHSRERSHSIDAAIHKKAEVDHLVHHEEKKGPEKRQKRRIALFLIANLFPFIQKKRSRLTGKRAARCLDLSRMLTFPSSAEKKAQAA